MIALQKTVARLKHTIANLNLPSLPKNLPNQADISLQLYQIVASHLNIHVHIAGVIDSGSSDELFHYTFRYSLLACV